MNASIPLPAFKCHAVSDVGLFRDNNEDSWATIPEHGIFIVADGLGGHQAGEVASKEAIEIFINHFHSLVKEYGHPKTLKSFEQYLLKSFYASNSEIFLLGQQHSLLRGMGTTFSLLSFFKKKSVVLHVGDSRIYRYRRRVLEQLSDDHLCIRPFDPRSGEQEHNSKGFLTKALGTSETLLPQLCMLPWQEDDFFLICSDGLSDLLSDKEIAEVLSRETLRLEEKVRLLVHLAKSHGGQDNITVLLVNMLKRKEEESR